MRENEALRMIADLHEPAYEDAGDDEARYDFIRRILKYVDGATVVER